MPYTPNSWVDGPAGNTPITAAQLAHVETQYSQAMADGTAKFQTITESSLTPYHFGAVSPVAGSDNTAALLALFQAAAGSGYPSGASIYLPPGLWRYNGTAGLPLASNLVIRGAGRRTRLASVGSQNLFEWNTSISAVNFENIWVECAVAGKAIFAPGASGGIFASTFKQCYMLASSTTSQIWNQNNGASFIHNSFRDCEMERASGSTVVPFSIINTGGGANFNQFEQVRLNGINNVTTPFIHVESTLSSTYLTDWTMINVLGEQNPAGILQVLGAFNWTLINVTDEDATTTYVANILDFQTNGAGLAPRDLAFIGCQRHGQSMTAGTYEISCPTATNVSVTNADPTPTSVNASLNLPKTANVTGTKGYPQLYQGSGSPETVVSAVVGSTYLRTDGGAATSLYVKESGTGNTGWIGK
jgi:hypothetical protein